MIFLIDSGSTHNFLDSKLVALLGVMLKNEEEIRVKVASGQEIVSSGRSEDLSIKIQGTQFHTDMFVLPLAGCEVVLGIHWLRILGPMYVERDSIGLELEFRGSSHLYPTKK